MTECNQETFAFTAHFSRRVEAGFTAGQVSTDGGSLLLREADRKINLLGRLAGCFSDGRAPLLVKHQLSETLAQRIYGLALGYEDLNDHEQLRRIRMRQIPDASAESLIPFVQDSVAPGSVVHTDGWLGYLPVKSNGYHHEVTYLKGNKKPLRNCCRASIWSSRTSSGGC